MSALASHNLTGAQKSAVLCLALGPEHAAGILQQLGQEQVEAVTREISLMESVDADVVQEVMREYQTVSVDVSRTVQGGVTAARGILSAALGETTAEAVVGKFQQRSDSGRLAHLEKVEPRMFANILVDEHPQTVAVILSHLDLAQAAKAVEELPPEMASEVLFRMAQMDQIVPDMLAVIEDGLKSKTDLSLSQELSTPGDAAKVAKLLTMTSGGRDEELLAEIELKSSELADKIKALMFTFEDLLLVEGKCVQRILREVDNKDLSLALKAASDDLRAHIRANMSERAGAALEEEMELLGAVRVKDVEAAQQNIMGAVRELEESGDVVVQRAGASDDFIN